MLSQGQVGPIASTADGIQVALRAGKLGEQIVSELHPRYYETAYRRNMFGGANQVASVTSANLLTAAAYTGLVLSNPTGSSVNLVLSKVSASFPVTPAAAIVVGLAVGYNASANHTTPVAGTLGNNFVGVGAAPVGLIATSVATLSAVQTIRKIMGTVGTGALTTFGAVLAIEEDFEGSVILPPGAFCTIYTSTAANTAGFLGSYHWEEVPI